MNMLLKRDFLDFPCKVKLLQYTGAGGKMYTLLMSSFLRI